MFSRCFHGGSPGGIPGGTPGAPCCPPWRAVSVLSNDPPHLPHRISTVINSKNPNDWFQIYERLVPLDLTIFCCCCCCCCCCFSDSEWKLCMLFTKCEIVDRCAPFIGTSSTVVSAELIWNIFFPFWSIRSHYIVMACWWNAVRWSAIFPW